VGHDHAAAGSASGEDDAVGTLDQRFREFIGFFASLVSLVGFGLGILPDSTIVEKFLVVVAAITLSCVVILAIRLVPKGRAAAWLAVSGALSLGCLGALSVVAQSTDAASFAAAGGLSLHGGAASSGTRPTGTAAGQMPVAAQSSGQSASAPSMTGVLSSQQAGYSLDYRDRSYGMPGSACQYSNTDNASNVSFTRQTPKVAVTDNYGGDMDISCSWNAATLIFNEQAAQVTGNPTPAQCAAAITINPLPGSIDFSQLIPGEEFCFIAGGGSPPGPLVLATLKSVAGSPSFAMMWTFTAWQMPPSSQ
jgi:hypothetical protein